MNTYDCTRILTEVMSINRQLLLMQIEKIEDEIIPLADFLQKFSDSKSIKDENDSLKSIISEAGQKMARLNSLKHELFKTEVIAAAEIS